MKNTQFTARQTAGNNEFLKSARATWNDPIYKEVLRLYNLYGRDTAENYLQRFKVDKSTLSVYDEERARSLQILQKAAAQTRRATFFRLARLTNELKNEVLDTYDEGENEALEIACTLLTQIESCFRRRA